MITSGRCKRKRSIATTSSAGSSGNTSCAMTRMPHAFNASTTALPAVSSFAPEATVSESVNTTLVGSGCDLAMVELAALHVGARAVGVELFFPDRHAPLHFVDPVAHRVERRAAMRGAHDDEHCGVSDLEATETMHDAAHRD